MGKLHVVKLGVQTMDHALEVHVHPTFTITELKNEIVRVAPFLANTLFTVHTQDGAMMVSCRDENGHEIPHSFDQCFERMPPCFLVYPKEVISAPPPPPPVKNDSRARIMCVRFVRGTVITPFRSKHMFMEFFHNVASFMTNEAVANDLIKYAERVSVPFPIKSGTPELVSVQRVVRSYLARFYTPIPAMQRHIVATGKIGIDTSKRFKKQRVVPEWA